MSHLFERQVRKGGGGGKREQCILRGSKAEEAKEVEGVAGKRIKKGKMTLMEVWEIKGWLW